MTPDPVLYAAAAIDPAFAAHHRHALRIIDRVIAGPQTTPMKTFTLPADDTDGGAITDIAGNGLSGANNAITDARKIDWIAASENTSADVWDLIDAAYPEVAEQTPPAVNAHNDAVPADGAGQSAPLSAKSAKPVRKPSARKQKRTRNAVQKVLDHLAAHPSDADCSTNELTVDVMELYAVYAGEWNDYHGNYRWQKLANAKRSLPAEQRTEIDHSALDDALNTLALLKFLARDSVQPDLHG